MARHVYVYRKGLGVIPIEEAPPQASWQPNKGVVTDTLLTPLESHADGKMYDSKSAMRASYKACGCEELGNDKVGKMQPAVRKDIKTFPEEKIYKELWERL